MVRIRWRDGMPKRPYYGAVGAFDSQGVSVRQWKDERQPFVRRFFALNQHRQWFDLVSDAVDVVLEAAEDAVAPPDVKPESPVLEVEKGSVVPVEAVAKEDEEPSEAAAPVEDDEEADDDEDHVERKKRRGRPKKVRKESAEGDW